MCYTFVLQTKRSILFRGRIQNETTDYQHDNIEIKTNEKGNSRRVYENWQ